MILAPLGGDASLASAALTQAGIASSICPHTDDLADALSAFDCAIAAEEDLVDGDRTRLGAWIGAQPPWSDFPFILLGRRGAPPNAEITGMLGNVSLIERPFHPATLVNAVRFSIRARRRQREAEAYLAERQLTAERQSLLIRELHHRVKNMLATVQALLGASSRSATDVNAFYTGFSARIVSLSKTHNLLTEDYWQTASLQEMLQNELSSYNDKAGRRIVLQGPLVDLTADLAVPTGMAIHELTSNAVKHGALSLPGGRLDIAWEIRRTDGRRVLHLDWAESGGPPTVEPTRRGFGSTLLQRVLTVQCGAVIRFDFRPQGLQFQMEAPLREARLVPHY